MRSVMASCGFLIALSASAHAVFFAVAESAGVNVELTRLDMLAVHDAGTEALVIDPLISFSGDAVEVRRVYCVIPLPAPASDLRPLDAGSLEPLAQFTEPVFAGGPRGRPIRPGNTPSWTPPPPSWGSWLFRRIEPRGLAGVSAVKAYLADVGVNPPADDLLNPYTDGQAAFVIGYYDVRAGQTLPQECDLPAFQLVFPSTELWAPIRLANGVKTLRLYTLTRAPLELLPLTKLSLLTHEQDENLKPEWSDVAISATQQHRRTTRALLPESTRLTVDALFKRAPALDQMRNQPLYLVHIYASDLVTSEWPGELKLMR